MTRTLFFAALICLFLTACSSKDKENFTESRWASSVEATRANDLYAPHTSDGRFFAPWMKMGDKNFLDVLGWKLFTTTAYHPRWFMHYQHMNVAEALQAFDDLGARTFIPTQWGTFHLGSEPAGFPGLDLQRQVRKNHLDPARFQIMDIGQIIRVRGDEDLTLDSPGG